MIRRTIHRVVESHTLTDQKEWNLEGIVDFAHNSICAPDELSISDLEGKSAAEIEGHLKRKSNGNLQRKTRAIEWRQSNA